MLTEVFLKTGFGRRLRKVLTPTAGAKKINSELYSTLDAPPATAPVRTAQPVIAGALTTGSVLTCTPGTYTGTPTPTVTRQWNVGLTPVPGATGLTYTILAADSGKLINCIETATNSAGTATGTSNNLFAA